MADNNNNEEKVIKPADEEEPKTCMPSEIQTADPPADAPSQLQKSVPEPIIATPPKVPEQTQLPPKIDAVNNNDEKQQDTEKQKESVKESQAVPASINLKNSAIAPDTKDIVGDEILFKSLLTMGSYHGFVPREDLRLLLRRDGDYLIRISEVSEKKDTDKSSVCKELKRDLILSVFERCTPPPPEATNIEVEPKSEAFEGKLRNVVIRRYQGRFGIEHSHLFGSVQDLLSFYHVGHVGSLRRKQFLRTPIPLQCWEYKHSDIRLGLLLGEGAYGEVRSGELRRKEKWVDVAIKLMKGGADMNKAKIREMMKEARLMRAFKHKNVVRFYGVGVLEQPLYILLELVKGGALNTYLRTNKGKVSLTDMVNMCLGAAQGLHYLHSNNCIHRDIAARNCLYTNTKIVKLSDFGLSRIGDSYKLSTSQKLPIKWLAAETINTLYFTFKTDVYSYGVMCFEIFTEGDEPWDGITNTDAKRNVVSGKHLQLPAATPEKIKRFIYEKVYETEPKLRVTMEEVVKFFDSYSSEIPPDSTEKCEKTEKKSEFGIAYVKSNYIKPILNASLSMKERRSKKINNRSDLRKKGSNRVNKRLTNSTE